MTSRGNNMWKILFNFVNVNSSELNDEVFKLVEDILCKDPSLICFQTGRDLEYSDYLLCWLINKLIENLLKSSLHRKSNLQLQKGLLSSCLKNRPVLFFHVTLCYADLINQIFECTQVLQNNHIDDDQELGHIIFGGRKIVDEAAAEELNFSSITINLKDAESLVEFLLQMLVEALSIGIEIHPHLFVACFRQVFKALKESGCSIKILCLKYMDIFFENVKRIGAIEEHFISEVLSSVESTWELVPLWLTLDIIDGGNITALSNITADITTKIKNLVDAHILPMQLLSINTLRDKIFCTLFSIIEVARACENSNDTISRLLKAYVELTFCFQMKFGKNFCFDLEECELLQTIARDYSVILRLLAGILVQESTDSSVCVSNLNYLEKELLNNIQGKNNLINTKSKHLLEILSCFAFLQNNLKSSSVEKKVGTMLQQQLNKNLLNQFVAEIFKPGIDYNTQHDVWISIAIFLLKINCIRIVLSPACIQKLLEYTQEPIKHFITSLAKGDKEYSKCVDQNALHASINSLSKLTANEIGMFVKNMQRSIDNYVKVLLATPKNAKHLENIKSIRHLFCQQLPHLVFEKFCSEEIIISSLSHNMNTCLFPLILKSITCDSKQCLTDSSTGILLNPFVTEALSFNVFENSNCCKKNCNANKKLLNVLKIETNLKIFIYQSTLVDRRYTFFVQYLNESEFSSKDFIGMLAFLVNAQYLNTVSVRLLISTICVSNESFFNDLICDLLSMISKAFYSKQPFSKQKQINLLQILRCSFDVCECEQNDWSFYFFKISVLFLLHPQSSVAHEAIAVINEMCQKKLMYPMQLWNWYKKESLDLAIKLILCSYAQKGVRFSHSLKHFTKMLGFTCVQELVCKYYRLMLTLLVPYCVKERAIKGFIVGISKTTRKSIQGLLKNSFLRIYTHVYTSDVKVGKTCLDMITAITRLSLNELLNINIKQTLFEFLVNFHRNSEFVKETFQNMYSTKLGTSADNNSSSPSFSSFIADRFLGIITYFESCLGDRNIEKSIKEAALCSLSEIIKFVGTEYVTKYRFKIIAMLEFVMLLNDKCLQIICLKIWNIFLHVVNIHEIGSSLSHIAASLQKHLITNEREVNAIYKFLILENGAKFDLYLPELYFLEDVKTVEPTIRKYIKERVNKSFKSRNDILEGLLFFCNQISSSNIQIRINGLKRLQDFISNHRTALNQLILNVIIVDMVLEKMTDVLVLCCRHEDYNLQLAASKCLGELGAVDPSYLPCTSSEQCSQITLGVHTDQFTVMALHELCRAYQSQKGTKYVDNFSIAIQETLSVSGVSPNENKKLEVWESMPLSMRQIMTPFLTSCYTVSRRGTECHTHPIYNSSTCRNFTDWAFTWATRLIEHIKTVDTKQLFNSYKPSIRRDDGILALFFPYILVHSLQDCTENEMQMTFEEFDIVFMSCQQAAMTQQTCDSSVLKEFHTPKYIDSINRVQNYQSANIVISSGENIVNKCSKLCSELIDFLRRWSYEWERTNDATNAKETGGMFERVSKFLKKFNKLIVAKSNFNTNEFARALIYLEEYIFENLGERLQQQISFLLHINYQLDDVDSVEGCINVKNSSLTLSEEILCNLMIDRPHEAMSCYEQLMSLDAEQVSQENIKGMINCYLSMETPETALLVADGLWQKFSEQYTDEYFQECKLDLYWRLGRYKELKNLLNDSLMRNTETNWSAQCAQAFLLFKEPLEESLEEMSWLDELDKIRGKVLQSMRSSFSSKRFFSYPNSYNETIKLHLLTEIEKAKLVILKLSSFSNNAADQSNITLVEESCLSEVKKFLTEWELRLNIVQPMVRVIGAILNFRRYLLLETKHLISEMTFKSKDIPSAINTLINTEIGNLWMKSSQMYRDGGNLQQAHISLMKAEEYAPKLLFIEKAKLFWKMGSHRKVISFKLLEENLQRMDIECKHNLRSLPEYDRALYAEAKFLQAKYSAESMSVCAELNLRYFKEAISLNKNSEKFQVNLAHYMEKIYNSYSEDQQNTDNGRKVILEVMLSYAKSLRCGVENVYQSLPRLLTLWLDYTTEFSASSAKRVQSGSVSQSSNNTTDTLASEELARKMNDLINNCSNVFSTSIFYTAFSQMLSRICHPSDEVFAILRTIIIKLTKQYPHQSLWKLLPVFKSFNTHRTKRCKLILTDSRLQDATFQKLLVDFNMLSERLIELTNKEVAPDNTYDLNTLVKQLPKLFEDPNFTQILLPFEKFMQISFPVAPSFCSDVFSRSSSESVPSNPFPHKQVFICGVNNNIIVLRSAAKPKKIALRCNDGQEYAVMVKPKDDLRRDFRLMEFNDLVKRYIHLDYIARNRRLRIRTYSVVPFNEECGLLEWLPKLNSFRNICTTFYRKRNLGMTDRQLRQHAVAKTDPIEIKRTVFLDTLLPKHPPVFQEWFLQRFPTPHIWYEARTSYVKTIAVMSIVGYILGLGDRHGENILFDETNGDAVHVDFNCLFNQGEFFAFPELVPFRLTHNMTYAMGPLKVEGLYRKTCEITLRILKHASTTLMSVLRPFVYDLVVYNRNVNKQQRGGMELTDPKAMMDVRRIDERLQGFIKKTSFASMPLSVEGQVNLLIDEAVNIDNLASMYIGWGAYL